MSKVERKEYQETRVVKTLSPGRGTRSSSSQNLSQFDNNLDYLLDDLQSSVGRPSSSQGKNTVREIRVMSNGSPSGRSNSLNRVTHMKASNPVTEYTSNDAYSYTLPDGSSSVKGYKKESYSYSSTGKDGVPPEKARLQNNINQLDSLLDDLKQTKQERGRSVGQDPNLVETHKSRVMMGKKVVERELHYGDTPPKYHSLDRSNREGSLTREIQYLDEGTYGETRPARYNTPSPLPSHTSTISKEKKVSNVQTYPVEVIETSTPDINPEILSHLDPNLLPSGNTKVTTTIKTYTYEIPGSNRPISPNSEQYVYSPNDSQSTPSKSFVYNKIENKDVTNTVHYPPPDQSISLYQKPSSPPGSGATIIKETTTTRNYQPPTYPVYNDDGTPSKHIYVYNETTKTRNINDDYPERPPTREPPVRNETYIIKEIHNNTTTNEQYPAYPPPSRDPPRTEKYIIKEIHNNTTTNEQYPAYPPPARDPPRNDKYIIKEIHNTTTNTVGPYPNGYPPQEPNTTTVIYNKHDTNTTSPNNYVPQKPIYNTTLYPQNRPNDPNDVNITYKYTTHSTTTNNYKNGHLPNEEGIPLLRPQKFPNDGVDGPPKRVDELMAKIGQEPPDSPYNVGFSQHEAELIQQKKVDALKQQSSPPDGEEIQKKERTLVPTKNITGPPVYYPPGHEMFAKKEEAGGGAWRAQGAMERESGKYKYESESSSKYQVKSGAAMVPVCLPCCCGLPCSIL